MQISRILTVAVACALTGCVPERATVPSPQGPESTLGAVVVSPPNAILAVGGTLQTTIVATSISGAELADVDSVLYVLPAINDTLRVRVSVDGLITARAPSGNTPVRLNVFAFKDGVGKADQMIVQVTSTAVPGLTLSIQPVPPDSSRLAKGSVKTIDPVIQNPNTAQSVANPRLRLRTDVESRMMNAFGPELRLPGVDGVIVQFPTFLDVNQVGALAGEGTEWVHAEVNAYGVVLRDSILYTLTYPFGAFIGVRANAATGLSVDALIDFVPVASGAPSNVTLAPGATVFFQSFISGPLGLPVTFTFDNPAAATAADPPSTRGGSSGDVTALNPNQFSTRRFLTAGTYKWTGTVGGNTAPYSGQSMSGTLVIK